MSPHWQTCWSDRQCLFLHISNALYTLQQVQPWKEPACDTRGLLNDPALLPQRMGTPAVIKGAAQLVTVTAWYHRSCTNHGTHSPGSTHCDFCAELPMHLGCTVGCRYLLSGSPDFGSDSRGIADLVWINLGCGVAFTRHALLGLKCTRKRLPLCPIPNDWRNTFLPHSSLPYLNGTENPVCPPRYTVL